jgi:addiction module RelB/DinJ family antitoxin
MLMQNKKEIKSSDVRSRIDKETKEKVEAILEEMGLNISTAIRMYFKYLIRKAEEK